MIDHNRKIVKLEITTGHTDLIRESLKRQLHQAQKQGFDALCRELTYLLRYVENEKCRCIRQDALNQNAADEAARAAKALRVPGEARDNATPNVAKCM